MRSRPMVHPPGCCPSTLQVPERVALSRSPSRALTIGFVSVPVGTFRCTHPLQGAHYTMAWLLLPPQRASLFKTPAPHPPTPAMQNYPTTNTGGKRAQH